MSAVSFSFRRALWIAENTLLEAVRQKLFASFLLLALALVGGARWLRDFNFGAPELKFLADCGLGAMAFFGGALSIAATAQLFFSEIENRTVLTLLAKPIGRAEFILGKLLGIAALIGAFCGLLTVLLGIVLWWREGELMREMPDAFVKGRVVNYAGLATAGFLQWLKLTVLAAYVLLVASFAHSQLFTVVTGFFILIICHLQHVAYDAYIRAGGWFERAVGFALATLFPNFHLFGVADSFAGEAVLAWAPVVRVALYGLGYVAVATGLAVFSFRQREI